MPNLTTTSRYADTGWCGAGPAMARLTDPLPTLVIAKVSRDTRTYKEARDLIASASRTGWSADRVEPALGSSLFLACPPSRRA
jgi:hypothetical protein